MSRENIPERNANNIFLTTSEVSQNLQGPVRILFSLRQIEESMTTLFNQRQ